MNFFNVYKCQFSSKFVTKKGKYLCCLTYFRTTLVVCSYRQKGKGWECFVSLLFWNWGKSQKAWCNALILKQNNKSPHIPAIYQLQDDCFSDNHMTCTQLMKFKKKIPQKMLKDISVREALRVVSFLARCSTVMIGCDCVPPCHQCNGADRCWTRRTVPCNLKLST